MSDEEELRRYGESVLVSSGVGSPSFIDDEGMILPPTDL